MSRDLFRLVVVSFLLVLLLDVQVMMEGLGAMAPGALMRHRLVSVFAIVYVAIEWLS